MITNKLVNSLPILLLLWTSPPTLSQSALSVPISEETVRHKLAYGSRLHDHGRTIEAKDVLESVHSMSRTHGPKLRMASALALALVCRELSQYTEAREYFAESLPLARELRNSRAESTSLAGIGVSYRRNGNQEAALYYLNEAVTVSEANSPVEAIARTELAELYQEKEQFESAREQLVHLVRIFRERDDWANEVNNLTNLGRIHLQNDKLETAIEHYQTALAISTQHNDAKRIAESHVGLGSVYGATTDYAKASHHFTAATRIAKKENLPDILQRAEVGLETTLLVSRPTEDLRNQVASLTATRGNRSGNDLRKLQEKCKALRVVGPIDSQIRVGQQIEDKLSPDERPLPGFGSSKHFSLYADRPGPVTISIESFEFDAYLQIRIDGEPTVADDRDSGIGLDARLVLELEEGKSYRVIVASEVLGMHGDFSINVADGTSKLASTPSLETNFFESFRKRATIKEAGPKIVAHLAQKASASLSDGRSNEHKSRIAHCALGIALETRDRQLEIRPRIHIAFTLLDKDDFKGALRQLEIADQIAEELGTSDDLRFLCNLLLTFVHGTLHNFKQAEHRLSLTDKLGAAANLDPAIGLIPELFVLPALQGDIPKARGHLERFLEAKNYSLETVSTVAMGLFNLNHNLGAKENALRMLSQWRKAHGAILPQGELAVGSDVAFKFDKSAASETHVATLGPLVSYDLAFSDPGPITIRVDSPDFDVLTWVECEDKIIAYDDDSGVGSNSRLFTYAQSEKSYRIVVSLRDLRNGEFVLSVTPGINFIPQEDYHSNEIEFYTDFASRAVERDDFATAALSKLREGNNYFHLHQWPKAEAAYSDCIQLSKRADAKLLEAEARNNLGFVFREKGLYAESRECCSEALNTFRQAELLPAQIIALRGIGKLEHECGHFALARQYFEECLSLARRLGQRKDEATALVGLGRICIDLRDFENAKNYLEEAKDLFRKYGHRTDESEVLTELGRIHLSDGELDDAQWYFEQCYATSLEQRDSRAEASSLRDIANSYLRSNEFSIARSLLSEALAVNPDTLDPRTKAGILSDLSLTLLETSDFREARTNAEQSTQVFQKLGLELDQLWPLATLARVGIATREFPLASHALEKARGIFSSSIDCPDRNLSISEASSLRSRAAIWGPISQDLSAISVINATEEETKRQLTWKGFAQADHWKNRSLLEGIREHQSGSRDLDLIRIRQKLRRVKSTRIAKLKEIVSSVQENRTWARIENLRTESEKLTQEIQELENQLAECVPQDALQNLPSPNSPDTIDESIVNRSTALIEFTEGQSAIYAYIFCRGDLILTEVGPRSEIERAAETLVRSTEEIPSNTSKHSVLDASKALSEVLIKNIAPLIPQDTKDLIIVPSESVVSVPFELLSAPSHKPERNEAGDFADPLLVDVFDVSYAPSASVLASVGSKKERQRRIKTLLVGDPVYRSESLEEHPGADTRYTWGQRELSRLKHAKAETLSIAWLLLDPTSQHVDPTSLLSRDVSINTRNFDLRLGRDASADLFARNDLRSYTILHLAAHGYADNHSSQRSGIALSYGEDDDGYLTIAEVMELDLDADLVVLSACQTAKGPIRSGDGVQSLARAFMYAGARSVLASFWNVDDRATMLLMTRFYENILGRFGEKRTVGNKKYDPGQPLPKSTALREAKLWLRSLHQEQIEKIERSATFGNVMGDIFGKVELGLVGAEQSPTHKRAERKRGIEHLAGLRGDEADRHPYDHPFYWAAFILIGSRE